MPQSNTSMSVSVAAVRMSRSALVPARTSEQARVLQCFEDDQGRALRRVQLNAVAARSGNPCGRWPERPFAIAGLWIWLARSRPVDPAGVEQHVRGGQAHQLTVGRTALTENQRPPIAA